VHEVEAAVLEGQHFGIRAHAYKRAPPGLLAFGGLQHRQGQIQGDDVCLAVALPELCGSMRGAAADIEHARRIQGQVIEPFLQAQLHFLLQGGVLIVA